MFHHRKIAPSLVVLVSCIAVVLPASASDEPVHATAAASERDWSIEFTPYLWAINMNIQLEGGSIDNTISLNTMEALKNISAYAMADMNVQYKRVGIMGDGMWSRLKTTQVKETGVGTFNAELQADMAWGTGAAFYEFRPSEQLTLSPYVGARWWRINTQLDLVDADGFLPSQSGDVLTRWADPIFGLMVGYDITDKVLAKTGGDVGGGVSKVSWQVMLGGEYKLTDWFTADVMYRVMGVNYQPSGDKLKISLNGILFGFKFHY